jgi:hypothetical protein
MQNEGKYMATPKNLRTLKHTFLTKDNKEWFRQLLHGKYSSRISETEVRDEFAVYHFPECPRYGTLNRLALYYETILIEHPENLLLHFCSFYRKKGILRQWDRVTIYFAMIRKWIDCGIVKPLLIDYENPKENSLLKVLDGVLDEDLKDRKYWKYLEKAATTNWEDIYIPSAYMRDVRSSHLKTHSDISRVVNVYALQKYLYSVNQALLASSLTGATPMTDFGMTLDSLKFKTERSMRLDHRGKVPAILEKVFDITVPYVESLSLEEIVKIRSKKRGPFNRFRKRMRDLAISIKSAPWDRQFEEEVEAAVKQDIIPEIQEIRRQMRQIQPDMKSTIIKSLVSQVPYIGSFSDVHDVVKTYLQKRQLERNSLYFLALL